MRVGIGYYPGEPIVEVLDEPLKEPPSYPAHGAWNAIMAEQTQAHMMKGVIAVRRYHAVPGTGGLCFVCGEKDYQVIIEAQRQQPEVYKDRVTLLWFCDACAAQLGIALLEKASEQ